MLSPFFKIGYDMFGAFSCSHLIFVLRIERGVGYVGRLHFDSFLHPLVLRMEVLSSSRTTPQKCRIACPFHLCLTSRRDLLV